MSSTPSNIYARLLFPKGHGYPMYFPEPNECLPEEYRELGARVGDVGIVTEDGSFDYLFNVCKPANHAINLNRTPHDFEYVKLSQNNDMRINTDAHAPKSYIASTAVQRTVLEAGASTGGRIIPDGVDACVQYTSSSLKGAMVELSNGATRFDLRNRNKIRKLAARCGTSWYQFANVDRGRMAHNGSLYVVTGCDKANTFQLASWSSESDRQRLSVTFTAAQLEEGRVSYSNSNETSSQATVRVGPREPSQKQDQCIFLRGFKVAIRGAAAAGMLGPVSLTSIVGARRSQIVPRSIGGSIPYDSNESRWLPPGNSSGSGRSNSNASADSSTSESHSSYDSSDGESDTSCDDVGGDLFPTVPMPYHPSNAILEWLLHSVPGARVVVADDEVWMSVLDKDDSVMPDDDELLRRVSNRYTPAFRSGGAYLVPSIVDEPSPIIQEMSDIFTINDNVESTKPSRKENQKNEYSDNLYVSINALDQANVEFQGHGDEQFRLFDTLDDRVGNTEGRVDPYLCDNTRSEGAISDEELEILSATKFTSVNDTTDLVAGLPHPSSLYFTMECDQMHGRFETLESAALSVDGSTELALSARQSFQLFEPWYQPTTSDNPALKSIIDSINETAVLYFNTIDMSIKTNEGGITFAENVLSMCDLWCNGEPIGDIVSFIDRMEAEAERAHKAADDTLSKFRNVRRHLIQITNNNNFQASAQTKDSYLLTKNASTATGNEGRAYNAEMRETEDLSFLDDAKQLENIRRDMKELTKHVAAFSRWWEGTHTALASLKRVSSWQDSVYYLKPRDTRQKCRDAKDRYLCYYVETKKLEHFYPTWYLRLKPDFDVGLSVRAFCHELFN